MNASEYQTRESGDACDYRLCAQSLRAYTACVFLPPDVYAGTTYSFCKGESKLTVFLLHNQPPVIKELKLANQDGFIGILGIWHHGTEELFFIQKTRGQPLYRSLRNSHDVSIEQGLHTLSHHLLTWHD